MEKQNKEFKPYVAADKVLPELTVWSIITGIILAVVFGMANAYLGLRVGMTVSASIPAAVISMGLVRAFGRKNAVLENNMVQTIGSAGESLAAGAIFTMPALWLWAKEGIIDKPSLITIFLIALFGGLLGVFFMVPLRNALIVKEHGILPYPEGTACAEVILVGEKGGSGAGYVFSGIGIAAVLKFIVDGLKVVPGNIVLKVSQLKTEFASQIYPALLGVGYICGLKISAYLFAGGILGWFVFIPAIVTFGGDTILYPASVGIQELYETGGASAIWSNYIKYIGAGAVAAGGILSLIKSLPLIITTFRDAIKGVKGGNDIAIARTSQDINFKVVIIGVLAVIVAIAVTPAVPISIVGALLIAVFGFFFATVSSRMVGLVGSSNNPVSGMAIATLLFSTMILKATGDTGTDGMVCAIAIGSVICIIAAMAGDTSQDLKTGYILGATPKKQQIGEIIGAVVSAAAIGFTLMLLDNAWGFGSADISAPQASLMKMIVEGVMDGNLPWALVFIGAFTAIVIEILGIPVLPVAIGLYLPLELSTPIMVGGLLKWFVDKKSSKKDKDNDANNGILFCSGLIAGEGLMGVILAICAVAGADEFLNISSKLDTGIVGAVVVFVLIIALLLKIALKKNKYDDIDLDDDVYKNAGEE